jgi:hypothetical protein
MNLQPVLKGRTDMASVTLAAKFVGPGFLERKPRENGDPVITLLAVDGLMDVSHFAKGIGGKEFIRAFRFLQAQDVRLGLFQQTKRQRGPEANGIDVPSC